MIILERLQSLISLKGNKSSVQYKKRGEKRWNVNIIFLDCDGVLNSMAYFEWLKESRNSLHKDGEYDEISDFHLQMLSKIYHTCNAHIVLTSTWRELDDESDMNCYPMYQYLVKSLAKYDMKIISKTPVINMNRPLEIVTWLDSRADKDEIKFVSLDDDFSKEDYEKYGIGDCLVHTRFFCNDISEGGLQQEHVYRAIEILNGE